MKSIIQEASSIAKAVEQGWVKAEKPAEFTVKILEESQKNFLGLTTRPAKIALFFGGKNLQKQEPARQRSQAQPAPRPQREVTREPRVEREQRTRQPEPVVRQERVERTERTEVAPKVLPQKKQYEPQWTPVMVENTQEWLTKTLALANLSHVQFTIAPQNFHLRITFNQHLLEDRDKEKQLLASFATLILEMLKRSFKTGLRGHKIVLTHSR